MRKIYRDKENSTYWDGRWKAAGVDRDHFLNKEIYPIKYSDMAVSAKGQRILEAGCGAGRVYFHYKNLGYDIKGIEYSSVAVDNILKKDPTAEVVCASVTELPFPDNTFDVVLSFGLYHNFEKESDLDAAFRETARVTKSGGRLVASVRFDSLENRLIESIVRRRNGGKAYDQFHRLHFDESDLKQYLGKYGFSIDRLFYARNVSFLFKFDAFRSAVMKSDVFEESAARSGGFQLNAFGRILDAFLHRFFPKHFSNIMIVLSTKK